MQAASGAQGQQAADQVQHFAYDADGHLRFTVDAYGGVLGREYDGNGNVWRETRYAQTVNWAALDEKNANAVQNVLDSDQVNPVTIRGYDAHNRLAFELNANQSLTRLQYDANGNLVQRIHYAYPVREINYAGRTPTLAEFELALQNSANIDGNLAENAGRSNTDSQNQQQLLRYDSANRLIATASLRVISSATGVPEIAWLVESRSLDANGNLLAQDSYRSSSNLSGSVLSDTQLASTWQALQANRQTSVQDGHKRMLYDSANRMVASAVAQGLDASGLLRWAVARNTYDKVGNLTVRVEYANALLSSADASFADQASAAAWLNSAPKNASLDHTSRYFYDSASRLSLSVDANGGVRQNEYDANGQVIRQTTYAQLVPTSLTKIEDIQKALAPANAQWSARETWLNDGKNRIEVNVYDAVGQAIYHIDAVGHVVARQFDGAGNLRQTRSYASAIAGNMLGKLPLRSELEAALQSSQDDRIERQVFDGLGRLRYHIDAANFVQETQYDSLGRVSETARYAQAISLDQHSLTGIANQVASLASVREGYRYDTLGQVIAKIDINQTMANSGYEVADKFSYNAFGQKTSFTNKSGVTWRYEYDSAGHVVKESGPEVEIAASQLVLEGKLAHVESGAKRWAQAITLQQYDVFGNLMSRSETSRVATETIGRDEWGDFTYKTYSDGAKRTTRYEYDALGRQIKTILPAVLVYDNQVDLSINNPDPAPLLVEATTTVSYDVFGNAVVNEDAAATYQGRGPNELARKIGNGNFSYKTYDAMGRVQYEVDALGYVTEYERNAFGEVTRLTHYANSNVAPEGALTVLQVYALLTGKGPDIATLTRLAQLVQNGASKESLAQSILDLVQPIKKPLSLLEQRAFITKLYANGLKRQPGNNEVDAWLASMRAGMSPAAVLANFILLADNSTYDGEAFNDTVNSLFAPYSITQSNPPPAGYLPVLQLYTMLLGKGPDKATLSKYAQQISSATAIGTSGSTMATIARSILDNASNEYPLEQSPRDFILKLYASGLNKVPSEAEVTRALAQLQQLNDERAVFVSQFITQLTASEQGAFDKKLASLVAPYTTTQNSASPGSSKVFELFTALTGKGPANFASLSLYARQIAQGDSTSVVAQRIMDALRLPASSDQEFVARLYRNSFGREATVAEVNYWVSAMQTSGSSRAELVTGILQAAQTQNSDGLALKQKVRALQAPYSLAQNGLNGSVIAGVLAQWKNEQDRSIRISYDQLGREIRRSEPLATLADANHLLPGAHFELDGTVRAAKTTATSYNGFGQAYRVQVFGADAQGRQITQGRSQYQIFDTRGQVASQIEVVEIRNEQNSEQEFGYLTTFSYDAVGNVLVQKEFATGFLLNSEVQQGGPLQTLPAIDAENDREVRYSYDAANRKTSETRINVQFMSKTTALADSLTARGDIRTDFYYDSVGNLVATRDHLGQITHSFYNDMGFVTAILVSSEGEHFNWRDGNYTEFQRDIFGQIIKKIEYANGGWYNPEQAQAYGQASAQDRVTHYALDSHGKQIAVLNAEGHLARTDYDVLGRIARQRQTVSNGNFGAQEEKLQLLQYDALGRLLDVSTRDNAHTFYDNEAIHFAHQRLAYNSFGEVVSKSLVMTDAVTGAVLSSVITQRNQYDNAGHVTQNDEGNGAPRSYLYDVEGRVTASIRVDGQGRQIKEETRYDLAGNIIGQTLANQAKVAQSVDRWGNLLTRSDARNANWVTTYSYNANNQLIRTATPMIKLENIGQLGLSSNLSFGVALSYASYDALGRLLVQWDARGNANRLFYNLDNQITREEHADGGYVSREYNRFGNMTKLSVQIDAEHAQVTRYAYDKQGQLLETRSAAVQTYRTDINASNGDIAVNDAGQQELVERFVYDEMGRRIEQINAAGERITLRYDLLGNLIANRNASGSLTQYRYDQFGHKVAERDANGNERAAVWSAGGQLLKSTNLAGSVTTYQYDSAGQMLAQTSVDKNGQAQQNLRQTFNAAGMLESIHDEVTGLYTRYEYDAAGNRTLEHSVKNGVELQHNQIVFDAQNRILKVTDQSQAGFALSYNYDANGNRIQTSTQYTDSAGKLQSNVTYNRYDSQNRATLVNAVVTPDGFTFGEQTHQITYDWAGKRTSDKYFGKNVIFTPGQLDGLHRFYEIDASNPFTTETYTYDTVGRLIRTMRDVVEIDQRYYDAAGRVIHAGVMGPLDGRVDTPEDTNRGIILQQIGVALDQRIDVYMEGRHIRQKTGRADIYYDDGDTKNSGYDGVGNLRGYTQVTMGGGKTVYRTTYKLGDSYLEELSTARNDDGNASTTSEYDVNGHRIKVTDQTKDGVVVRTLENDSQGHILQKTQVKENKTTVTRSLIVNGELIGSNDSEAAGNLANPYDSINAGSLSSSPTIYQVQSNGETLQSVAKAMWGDSKLWYMIADANALNGQTLVAGQQLKIPQRVNTVLNDANSFKPYDASKLLGTTTPDLLPPAAQPCGGNGQIIVTLVAIVIAVTLTVMAGPEISFTFWEAMTVAAIANVGSQMVGNIIGAQDGFSFESFALSVISAGVSNKIPVFKGLEPGLGVMVKAAISNAVTQGIGVALQLQEHFDWRGVAAAGLGASIVGDGRDPFSAVGRALAQKVVYGNSMSWKQAATDVFGNLIGSTIGSTLGGSFTEVDDDVTAGVINASQELNLEFGSAAKAALQDSGGTGFASRFAKFAPYDRGGSTGRFSYTDNSGRNHIGELSNLEGVAMPMDGPSIPYLLLPAGADPRSVQLQQWDNDISYSISINGSRQGFHPSNFFGSAQELITNGAGGAYNGTTINAGDVSIAMNFLSGHNQQISQPNVYVFDANQFTASFDEASSASEIHVAGIPIAIPDASEMIARDDWASASDVHLYNQGNQLLNKKGNFDIGSTDMGRAYREAVNYQLQDIEEKLRPFNESYSGNSNLIDIVRLNELRNKKGLQLEEIDRQLRDKTPMSDWTSDEWERANRAAFSTGSGAGGAIAMKGIRASAVRTSPNTQCGCFVAGTLVWTKHGKIPIEEIRIGDLVLSQPEATGQLEFRPVADKFVYDDKEIYRVKYVTDDGESEEILATGNHPFWVMGEGWTGVEYLAEGDVLELQDRRNAVVMSVEYLDGLHRVFNFEVSDFHTYYVGEIGVWVHNQACVICPKDSEIVAANKLAAEAVKLQRMSANA